MDYANWVEELKEKRKSYGIPQKKLALVAGIGNQYLSDIERGKFIPTEKIKLSLLKSLEFLNPNNTLDMLIDYVRIRFVTTDIEYVMNEIIRIKLDKMIHEESGLYNYSERYVYGNIMVLASNDILKGVLLELRGQGCRQYERFLQAQGRTWYDFFNKCIDENAIFKRLDLAINDKVGILDIPRLVEKCKHEECISKFRSWKNYKSGDLIKHEDKPGMGNTLYIGSLKSEVYFCIYEKDYEQLAKRGIPLGDTETKNRFEIRLQNDRADIATNDLVIYRDAERTAFSIINQYIRFADKDEGRDRKYWKTSYDWELFTGEHRERLKLTVSPEPITFERSWGWVRTDVSQTLRMFFEKDDLEGTSNVIDLILETELNDKFKKRLYQQQLPVEEAIV